MGAIGLLVQELASPLTTVFASSAEPDTQDKARVAQLSKRILIVDDHEAVRRGLRTALQDAGFEVIGEAANGKEGVEKTRQLKPDLIILDVTMPVMSGFEATREILKSNPTARILIFTMHESEPVKKEAARVGAWGYIVKSAPLNELIESVRNALAR